MDNRIVKVLLTGLGSIGSRYYDILKRKRNIDLFVFRSSNAGSGDKGGNKFLYEWEEVKRVRPEVAFIANPTSLHIETAIRCSGLGMHLFIEKPLDAGLSKLNALTRIMRKNNVTAYVAYCLRFHPGIIELKDIVSSEGFLHAEIYCSSWLPDWRPGKDSRLTYSAKKKMGGGVILDLSHEIDYSQYIFGEITDIKGRFSKVAGVTVDAEDNADFFVFFKNGKYANVHLDFCSRNRERTVKVTTKNAFYRLDLITNELTKSDDNGMRIKKYNVKRNDLYDNQIKYFFKNIGNKNIMNNIEDAAGLLKRILKFRGHGI